MSRFIIVLFLLAMGCPAHAGILIESPNGVLVQGPTSMAAACSQKLPIHVTSVLSAVQSNISSATVHYCSAPINIHPGGGLGNSTHFFATGTFTAGDYQVFYGTAPVNFGPNSLQEGKTHVDWFGGTISGADNHAAIIAAVNSLPQSGGAVSGVVWFDQKGIYSTSSLFFSSFSGLSFAATTASQPGVPIGTTIQALGTMADLFRLAGCQGFSFKNLELNGNLTATHVLNIDQTSTSGPSERGSVYNCFIDSAAENGANLYISPTAPGNVSNIEFYSTTFQASSSTSYVSNVYINSTNALNNRFFGCNFWGRANTHIYLLGGSVFLYDPNFENSRNYDILSSNNGYFDIYGGYSETGTPGSADGNGSIYVTGNTATNPIVISGFTQTCLGTSGISATINMNNNNQLMTVIGTKGGIINNTSTMGITLLGSTFPGGVQGTQSSLVQSFGPGGLSSIKGISSTGTASANLSGKVTMSGTPTSQAVTLTSVEADTNYNIQLTPSSTTGTPASGAYTIMSVSKTTGGFTFYPVSAPGTGNSVTWSWLLVR